MTAKNNTTTKDQKNQDKRLQDYKLKVYANVLGRSKSAGMTRLYMAFNQISK